MSDLLKAFYLAYVEWLDDGVPLNDCFNRANGLCSNLHWFARKNKRIDEYLGGAITELEAQFANAGLSKEYPFNDQADYWSASESEIQHLNPKRIAWVRNQVEKIKEQNDGTV